MAIISKKDLEAKIKEMGETAEEKDLQYVI